MQRYKNSEETKLGGNTGMPAVDDGYIYVYLDDDELHIASVPSFNLMGDNRRQNLVENFEEFSDEDGNEYAIRIYSSNDGVEWELEIYPKNEKLRGEIAKKIRTEFEPNPV